MNSREKVEVGKHKKESVSLSQCDLIQFMERGFKYIHCYKEAERKTCSILIISTTLLYALEGNPENANMFKSAKKTFINKD